MRAARFLVVWVAACVLLAAQPTSSSFDDFPQDDQEISGQLQGALRAKRAAELLASQPTSVETFDVLVDLHRFGEAVETLRRVFESGGPQCLPMLDRLSERIEAFTADLEVYTTSLEAALLPLRNTVDSWPREQAANAAWMLVLIDGYLHRGDDEADEARRAQFMKKFAGTQAAEIATVVSISSDYSSLPRQVTRLGDYWKANPNTAAGAMALYLKGFRLRSDSEDPDPTNRLLEVAAIVKELESGRYPAGPWVTDAPDLMRDFFVSDSPPPVYGPGNVERSLAAYREFVLAQFERGRSLEQMGYLIFTRMGALYERVGDRHAGIDRLLDELESRAANPMSVRLAKARHYRLRAKQLDADATDLASRADALFTEIADANIGATSRQALAEIASEQFNRRDERAASTLQLFIDRFPESSWAWVAAMRRGQLLEETGDFRSASDTYRGVAKPDNATPLAKVIALTNVARVSERQADFEGALAAYREALSSWDADYGEPYDWETRGPNHQWRRDRITRSHLSSRVSELEGLLPVAGGSALARARKLFADQRFEEARTAIDDVLRRFATSPIVPKALNLSHEIQFEQALKLAAVTNPTRNEPAAIKALDAFIGMPIDPGVFAGRIAKASLLFRRGQVEPARELMRAALSALVAAQQSLRDAKLQDIAADIAGIRSAVFRPLGDLPIYREGTGAAFRPPATLPPFVTLRAEVLVAVVGQRMAPMVSTPALPGIPHAIYFTPADSDRLRRIMAAIGGSGWTGAPTLDASGHAPDRSNDLVAFWSELMPASFEWGFGLGLASRPALGHIEFLNAERTRATASVGIGNASSLKILVEKIGGRWVAIRVLSVITA